MATSNNQYISQTRLELGFSIRLWFMIFDLKHHVKSPVFSLSVPPLGVTGDFVGAGCRRASCLSRALVGCNFCLPMCRGSSALCIGIPVLGLPRA